MPERPVPLETETLILKALRAQAGAAPATGAPLEAAAAALAEVVTSDPNGYAVGHAMDALRRLAAAALAQGDDLPLASRALRWQRPRTPIPAQDRTAEAFGCAGTFG